MYIRGGRGIKSLASPQAGGQELGGPKQPCPNLVKSIHIQSGKKHPMMQEALKKESFLTFAMYLLHSVAGLASLSSRKCLRLEAAEALFYNRARLTAAAPPLPPWPASVRTACSRLWRYAGKNTHDKFNNWQGLYDSLWNTLYTPLLKLPQARQNILKAN